jgi:hypothetical protein
MNLVEEADSLIPYQFSSSSKLKGLLKALIQPFNELMSAIQILNDGQYIKDAHNQRLDILGQIVGQTRKNMDDKDYSGWINVGVKLNNSSGTPEDILGILNIIYREKPEVLMHEYEGNIFFTLFKSPAMPLNSSMSIVQSASPITTRCHFICAFNQSSFRFDTTSFDRSNWAEFFGEHL